MVIFDHFSYIQSYSVIVIFKSTLSYLIIVGHIHSYLVIFGSNSVLFFRKKKRETEREKERGSKKVLKGLGQCNCRDYLNCVGPLKNSRRFYRVLEDSRRL